MTSQGGTIHPCQPSFILAAISLCQTPLAPMATLTAAFKDNARGSRMTYSRLIGALFLLGFLFYGVGAALVTSVK